MIKDAYNVVEQNNAWENVDSVEMMIAKQFGHTGATLAFVMRQMHYIAENGLDKFEQYVIAEQ